MSQPVYEDITPANIEQRLRFLSDELERANNALRDARQAELVAQTALTDAKADATLSPECPVVGRGPGETNVGYRNAWVARRIAPYVRAYEQAKTMRQAATDYVKTVRDQTEVARSLGVGAREAYRGIGGPR